MHALISISAPNPHWPYAFEEEKKNLAEALGSNCIAIHHIGSTSVPELPAKPIIDISPVVKDILKVDHAITAMERLGYEAKGERGMAFRRFFQKGRDATTHNVHVFEEGNKEIDRHLLFRDWMRTHPLDREAYGQLKVELSKKHPYDLAAYCEGKEAFVASIDAQTGWHGFRMVQALTRIEWQAVHDFRQSHFKDVFSGRTLMASDTQVHWVFYKDIHIIGYAEVNVTDQSYELFVLKSELAFKEEEYLRSMLERWVSHQRQSVNCRSLQS